MLSPDEFLSQYIDSVEVDETSTRVIDGSLHPTGAIETLVMEQRQAMLGPGVVVGNVNPEAMLRPVADPLALNARREQLRAKGIDCG